MLMRYKSLWRVTRSFPLTHCGYSGTPAALNVNPAAGSSAASPATENSAPKASEISNKSLEEHDNSKTKQSQKRLVSAAFTSLKEVDSSNTTDINDPVISKITSADNVEDLLSITIKKDFQRSHALKVVSKLAEWTSEGKVKLIEFEGDSRFVKLCDTLGHNVSTMPKKNSGKLALKAPAEFTDLGVVLGVAGDDEAAKLVNTITVPQMIKVLTSLAYKKRRSIPLLRALAFNIGKSSDELNIKDCADILYGCAQLSFQDEVLIEKVCSDLSICIGSNNRPAVVGSVIKSLGFLKYKDKELLDLICEWVMKNFAVCRIQDLTSLVLTLAAVNHIPANENDLFKKLESHLQQTDLASPLLWLDIVWALVLLNKANFHQISSVLDEEFITRLSNMQPDGLNIVTKLKLLNINGAAKLVLDKYPGPFLKSDSEIKNIEVPRAKEKQALVVAVIDTLSNLLPSSVYMNTNINTGMGYIIDGECVVDSNLTPLPLIDKKTGKPIDRTQSGVRKGTRVAVLVLDYHDVTRGTMDPAGIASLAIRLTQMSGYKVITVPYYDFNPKDKLVTRVQYLEQQLKTVVSNVSSSSSSCSFSIPSPPPMSS